MRSLVFFLQTKLLFMIYFGEWCFLFYVSTSENFLKGEKIRAARRRRKELRRLEQIRRKEWRLAHQNPETGDYDEYGAFPGLAELESVDKKQARKQRRHKRKQNSEKKKKTKQQSKKKGSKGSKDRGTFSRNELQINL